MHPQYNDPTFCNTPPPPGQAYILLLDDPDDEELYGFEVWTTKAPFKYVHSKTFYAFRDPTNKLNAFLLKLKNAGSYPRITLMQVVAAADAAVILKARERRRKRGA